MPGSHHPFEVEWIITGESSQIVCSPGYILQRSGPATAGLTDSPVFKTPNRDICICQSSCYRSNIVQIEVRTPTTTMDQNDNWIRSVAVLGKPQVPKLEFVIAVPYPLVGRTNRQFLKFF